MKLLKNKKVLIGISGLFVIMLGIGLYFWFNKDDNIQVYKSKNEEIKMQISGFNGIAMMYETGPGTGEYSESKSGTWPESGYIFNENLSACENGGKLSWNDETKVVTLHSNKSDSCYVYFDAYIIPVINSVTTSNITTDSITLTVNATAGDSAITTYYYAYGDNEAVSSTSNTYTFNNLESGTEYNFRVYVIDEMGYESSILNTSVRTENPLTLAEYVISQYNGVQGNNEIYYHTSSLANSAGDNSYRYAGANPNNYVCFGSDTVTCPSYNLYRIIGVFDGQVKLIMADYPTVSQTGTMGAYQNTYSGLGESTSYYKGSQSISLIGVYHWTPSGTNIWGSSTLTTTNLNNTFLNTFGDIWREKISNTTWYVNGYSTGGAPPAVWYDNESAGTAWSGKIGLMYVSDYGFAASPSAWTTNVVSYNSSSITSNNWMYMGLAEWTISRQSSNSNFAYAVYIYGDVYNIVVSMGTVAVRPCFYLNSDVLYSSGSGTKSDPIRIN